jgi:hypothetical protein
LSAEHRTGRTIKAFRGGVGVFDALLHRGPGEVVAWFSRACYVRGPGGVVALVGPGVNDGPIHLLMDESVPQVPPRSPARLSTEELEVGPHRVCLAEVVVWRGSLPEPDAVAAVAPVLAEVAGEAAAGSLLPQAAAAEARALLERDDLDGVARVLGGLGPGLTPSGDDVLGGVLFALRAARGPAEEPRLAEAVDAVATNDISRAFLQWAARGQALSPAHDLVGAVVAGDRGSAGASARALAAVGESSGADFALGLRWGMSS